MSRLCIYNVNDCYNVNNAIFKESSFAIGDDLGAPFRALRDSLIELGHTIDTPDVISFDLFDGFLFLDLPDKGDYFFSRAIKSGKPLYLLLFECDVIRKRNWDLSAHQFFDVIFTWNPLYSSDKYVQYYWPNPISSRPSNNRKKEKLCVIMAGNKWSNDPRELYSERLRAIRWFDKNRPNDLDLYGPGWNPDLGKKIINSAKIVSKKIRGKPSCSFGETWENFGLYRGFAVSKRDVLSGYKFSICYENAQSIPGYITEKIFDCFFAGVVPIYMGWEDIHSLIPRGTYIDRRSFSGYDQIYKYITSMPHDEYEGYLDEAQSFLSGEKGRIFGIDFFVGTLIKGMGLSK